MRFSFSTTCTGMPDRAALVGERARHGLADPPGGVGRELLPAAMVELLRGAHESDRPLLDQVEEGQALVAIVLGDRDDQPQVGLDHVLLRAVVAPLDPLGELDLLAAVSSLMPADLTRKRASESIDVSRVDLERELGRRVVDELDVASSSALGSRRSARPRVELVERRRDLLVGTNPAATPRSIRTRASSSRPARRSGCSRRALVRCHPGRSPRPKLAR